MLYLYLNREQPAVQAEELSQAMKIPLNYLQSVIALPKKAGYVETVRGRFGGYRITSSADEISLYDIIQLLEPERINRCLDPDHFCTRQAYGVCSVSRFYELAQEQWNAMLKKITLKVLAANPEKEDLRKILNG